MPTNPSPFISQLIKKTPTNNLTYMDSHQEISQRSANKYLEPAPQLETVETVTRTKLADLANYSEEEHHYIIQQYRKLRLKFPKQSVQPFFNMMNTEVQFLDVDTFIERNQATARLWAFLLNYIIKFNFLKKNNQSRPYFKFVVITQQNTKFGHLEYNQMPEFMNCLMQPTFYEAEKFDSIILLTKKSRKYFGTYYKAGETTIVDFGFQEKSNLSTADHLLISKFILSQDFGHSIREDRVKYNFQPLVELAQSDQSEYLFAYLLKVMDGKNPAGIRYSSQESPYLKKQLEYVVIMTGFNDLQRIYEDEIALEQHQEQERILVFQRMKQADQLKQQHLENPFDDPKPKLRLDTPPHPDELDNQVEILEKRLKYLKSKQGNPELLIEMLNSAKVKDKQTQLDHQVDRELEELDKLLLQSNDVQKQKAIYKSTAQLKQLDGLYQLLNGKFQSQLFEGLDLPIERDQIKHRRNIFNTLRQSNINSVTEPLLKNGPTPGIFLPPHPRDPAKAVIAYRYSLQITRQHLIDLKTGLIDNAVIEIFLSFLEEFNQINSTPEWRRKHKMDIAFVGTRLYNDLHRYHNYLQLGNDKLVDFGFQRKYFQNYNKLLIPIQNGFPFEYQLAVVLVDDFKLIHYHLCELPSTVVNNKRHQIHQAWQQRDEENEKIDLFEQRTKQQDRTLSMLIHWIQRTARHFHYKQLGDMKLWTIRLETNVQITSPRQTGLYLLLLCSLIICGQNLEFQNDKLLECVQLMPSVVEYVLVSLGIGQQALNPQAILSFQNEMKSIIKLLT